MLPPRDPKTKSTSPRSSVRGRGPQERQQGEDDSDIQRLTDLFDALPVEPAAPREDRTSVDAGWALEAATPAPEGASPDTPPTTGTTPLPARLPANTLPANKLSANTLSADRLSANTLSANKLPRNKLPRNKLPANTLSANKLPASPQRPSSPAAAAITTVPPPTEPEPTTLRTGDSAPPTEPEPVTEPSLDEQLRVAREGGRDHRPHADDESSATPHPSAPTHPNVASQPSTSPLASEPPPTTEPEVGRLAAPPPLQSQRASAPHTAAQGKRGVPQSTVVAIAIVCLGVGFAAAWLLKPTGAGAVTGVADAAPAGLAAGPGSDAAALAPTSPGSVRSEGGAGPELPASVAPATTQAASAGPTPSGPPPFVPPDGKDGSELLSYEGYLVVRSRERAEVLVQGRSIGFTNERLLSRCHQRNVRLRDPHTAQWLTEGQSVDIACRATTTVDLTGE